MGLIRHQSPQIVVEISDLVIESTEIKRKARFDRLLYQQGAEPTFGIQSASLQKVTIGLTIQHFAKAPDGSYGTSLEGRPGFSSYQHNLIADNSSLVDAATGEVICDASEYNKVESVLPGGILYGRDFMYEDEFFRRMAELVDIKVDDTIIHYIQTASQLGKL